MMKLELTIKQLSKKTNMADLTNKNCWILYRLLASQILELKFMYILKTYICIDVR